MDINYLIQLLENRANTLNLGKDQAFQAGDLERINAVDAEILSVQETLNKLKLVNEFSNAAATINTSPAEIIVSGVEAIMAPTIQGPSASAIVNGYDISAYATDPSHEQKIQTIVDALPVMTLASDINAYIQNFAVGSPVTGEMILNAVGQFSVDIPLLMAIMQNDSAFGTAGVGANTFNPGNIGNTGSETRTYDSWQGGVTAVAEWLSGHKILSTVPEILNVKKTEEPVVENMVVEVSPIETPPEDVVVIPEENSIIPESQ